MGNTIEAARARDILAFNKAVIDELGGTEPARQALHDMREASRMFFAVCLRLAKDGPPSDRCIRGGRSALQLAAVLGWLLQDAHELQRRRGESGEASVDGWLTRHAPEVWRDHFRADPGTGGSPGSAGLAQFLTDAIPAVTEAASAVCATTDMAECGKYR